jgi:hypothetical protein
MIRKEVERIMGLVFTPEELKVITTAVKVSKSKLYHKKSETKEDLKIATINTMSGKTKAGKTPSYTLF